jgi:hypothetical protein
MKGPPGSREEGEGGEDFISPKAAGRPIYSYHREEGGWGDGPRCDFRTMKMRVRPNSPA